MTKSPYRPNFKRNLARTITLANGRKLKSLDDARTVILDVFGSVNARSGALDHVIAGSSIAASILSQILHDRDGPVLG